MKRINISRKFAAGILVCLMSLMIGMQLMGCGGKAKEPAAITDQAGRSVKLPQRVEKIASLWPEATRVVYALGEQNKLVGVDSASRTCPVLTAAFPGIKDLKDLGSAIGAMGGGGTFNMETLAEASPDIVFMSTDAKEIADKVQENLRIPVVCVRIHPMLKGKHSFNLFPIIGKCLGKEKEGSEMKNFLEKELSKITSVTSSIPTSEKPKVYQAFAQDLLKTIGVFDVISLAGGKSVAEGGAKGAAWYSVSFEDVLRWDPEIVVLHGFGRFNPQDLYADPGWQKIKAVKDKRVFKLTLGWTGWDPGGFVVNVMQNAKVFHPKKFTDLNVEKEANFIFERLYGVKGLYTKLKHKYGLSL